MNISSFMSISCVSTALTALLTPAVGLGSSERDHHVLHEGEFPVATLAAAVEVVRDGLSIPSIRAESFEDAISAQGFIHAQERFFQMDAGRRLAAGELAELAPQLVDMDRQYRPYRFRDVARRVVERLDDRERQWLEVYTAGVNAGLEHLPAPPLEYATLNLTPQPWKPEDSVLVLLAMFDFLHMEASFEKRLGVMRDALPEELFEFLTPDSTRFDVPLIHQGDGETDWTPLPIPGPDVIDLRGQSASQTQWVEQLSGLVETAPPALGSNNWAVAGSRTADGRAILANDPHLRLSAPGIWYRAELQWQGDASESPHRLVGLTLPGTPGIVIGCNEHLAWGFTNTMGDFQDLIVIEVHPDDPEQYRTPDGYEAFETITERINIRGRGSETMQLRSTRWGIVTDVDHHGRPLVLNWTALDPELVDLSIINLSFATTLEQGVDIAARWGGPAQNILFADDTGRIAWVVSGNLPKRFGFDGRYPVSWADGDVGWDGMIAPHDKPRMLDPEDGVLFTANNRTVGINRARTIGGVWTAGERAHRINQLLQKQELFDEAELFHMQLDTRVEVFDFYRDLAVQTMAEAENEHEAYAQAREILASWNGTADADQPAMHMLNIFRHQLQSRVISALVAPARRLDERFSYRWFMDEEPLRRLLEERPPHMLPPRYSTWDELVEGEWRNTLSRFAVLGHDMNMPWGEVNKANIQHPLAMGVPAMAQHLNLPPAPQPGHPFALRVATPTFGASARLVVSPGRESDGILHIPAGQSGHPRSPHYTSGHDAWLAGKPLPLLPGEANATLRLVPK